MRRSVLLACMILIWSTCALASDFSSLPPEAQSSIKATMERNLPDLSTTLDLTISDYTLTASDGVNSADFGASIAIDGNTVVVGAIQDLTNGKGAVYVFVKPPSGWANLMQTAELTASDGQIGDRLGCSVGISGNTIVAGACRATVNGNQSQGAAYVFVEPAGGWRNMTETAKLTSSDGERFAFFGASTAISGNTVLVGAPYATIQSQVRGQAYVFVEPEAGWSNMTQTAELAPSDGHDYFGWAVAIDGNTALVTGCGCNSADPPGEAYVFVEPLGGWMNTSETAKLAASDGNSTDSFGISASISGQTVVVGDSVHGFEKGGAVYVFVEPSGGWVTMTQNAILDVSPNKFGCLGISVSISGSAVLTGDDCANGSTGAAYVYRKPADGWQDTSHYTLRLLISFPLHKDYFGASVGISGTTGVIGAPGPDTGPGQAFIFTAAR